MRTSFLLAAVGLSLCAGRASSQDIAVQSGAPGTNSSVGAAGAGVNANMGPSAGNLGVKIDLDVGKRIVPAAKVEHSPVVGSKSKTLPIPARGAAADQRTRLPVHEASQRPGAIPGNPSSPSKPLERTLQADPGGVGRIRVDIQNLDEAGKRIKAAQEAQVQGDAAAVQKTLDQFFEDQRLRAAARQDDLEQGAGVALPDPKHLGPEIALNKIVGLAKQADPVDAPMLYRHAFEMIHDHFQGKAVQSGKSRSVFRSAVRQADPALRSVAQQALEAAASGSLRDRRREKVFDALDFWNSHLILSGLPYMGNLPELKAAISHVSRWAKENAAVRSRSPKVLFQETRSPAGAAGFKAVVTLSDTMSDVPGVPQIGLAFELKGAALAAMDLGEASPISDAFDLASDHPSFQEVYQARRAAGKSALAGFWTALQRWTGGQASGFFAWLKRMVQNSLRLVGLLEPAGQDFSISVISSDAPTPGLLRELGRRERGSAKTAAVRMARAGLSSRAMAVRSRFEAFGLVMDRSSDALGLIARNAERMALSAAKDVYEDVRASADAYDAMNRGSALSSAVDELWRGIEAKTAGLSGDQLLPQEALDGVVAMDKPSLHRLAGTLREQAVDSLGRYPVQAPANLAVRVDVDGRKRTAVFLDISAQASARKGAAAPQSLDAAVSAMAKTPRDLQGSMIVQGQRFWGDFPINTAVAQVYADLRQPQSGGMLRIRYQDQDAGWISRARKYFVARALYELGFAVSMEAGVVTAATDKDRGAHSLESMTREFGVVLRVLNSLQALDQSWPGILEGSFSHEDTARRVEEQVRIALEGGPQLFSAAPAQSLPADAPSVGVQVKLVSRGSGVALSAPVTYEKAKAAQGDAVFITPYADDLGVVGKSKAVLFTSGDASSQGAIAARRAGVPAAVVEAQWTSGSGIQIGSGGRFVVLREGNQVRFDPVASTVQLLP